MALGSGLGADGVPTSPGLVIPGPHLLLQGLQAGVHGTRPAGEVSTGPQRLGSSHQKQAIELGASKACKPGAISELPSNPLPGKAAGTHCSRGASHLFQQQEGQFGEELGRTGRKWPFLQPGLDGYRQKGGILRHSLPMSGLTARAEPGQQRLFSQQVGPATLSCTSCPARPLPLHGSQHCPLCTTESPGGVQQGWEFPEL